MKIGLLLLISVSLALGAPVQWASGSGGNNHYYEVVILSTGLINWAGASAAAQGMGGYLVTVTSAAENTFVWSLVTPAAFHDGIHGPFLGGFQPPGTGEPSAGWEWVTGEPWSFTDWGTGEPNNVGEEDYLHLKNRAANSNNGWNDIPGNYQVSSYIVERDAPNGDVPEPGTLFVIGGGFLLLGALRRFPLR